MSDQVFSKVFTPSGPETPARRQTLNCFLNTTIDPEFETSQMIAAVQSDPRILLHFLAVTPPKNLLSWQQTNLAATISGVLSAAANFDSAGKGRCRSKQNPNIEVSLLAEVMRSNFELSEQYSELC